LAPEEDAPVQISESLGQSPATLKIPELRLASSDPTVAPSPGRVLAAPIEGGTGFKWKTAATDSFRFLMLETAGRIVFQSKTHRSLGGAFLKDYLNTLRKAPSGFMDGDEWLAKVVTSPMQIG
jgi:hypothetical protein